MSRMKTVIICSLVLLGLAFPTLSPLPRASAVDILNTCTSSGQPQGTCSDCKSKAADTNYCKDAAAANANGTNPVVHIITTIINILSFVAGAAVIISLIVFGLKMIMANGDANGIATARTGILYSLIGVVVIALAQSIVVFVLDRMK